ncbi:Hsp20/alpha crystallin family protein [Hydrogenophilus thiooxidans]|uniref:Hsp20/alpha crystallin family protein n=1 Tax=Hydrogenophilus thiooxidans TaxID=2820326 RepID=UPI001C23E7BF|nr:Hsp20/alpha crystallin family protein [Hydrogenophilus thiooxidans]
MTTPTERTVPTTARNPQQTPEPRQAEKVTVTPPRVDIVEDETGITLWADLPGVSKEALEVKIEGETLTIEGSVSLPTPEGLEPLYAEVRTPRFARQFTLSRELDPEGIEAKLQDGVLQLRIPKRQHAQPRRIAVQVA